MQKVQGRIVLRRTVAVPDLLRIETLHKRTADQCELSREQNTKIAGHAKTGCIQSQRSAGNVKQACLAAGKRGKEWKARRDENTILTRHSV